MSTLIEPLSSADATSRPLHVHQVAHPWVKRWLIALTVLLVAGWLVSGVVFVTYLLRSDAAVKATPVAVDEEPPSKADSSPWGRIVYSPIMISPPLEFVPETAPMESHQVVWLLPGMNPSRAAEWLAEVGVSDAVRRGLLELMQFDPSAGGMALRPSREFVVSLSAADRAKLYVALAAFTQNSDQVNAYRYHGATLDEWLAHSRMLPQSRALIEPLIYRHNGQIFFADMRSIEPSIESAEERMLLLKTLSRESTFLAKLYVDENADIRTLVEYWSRGGRAKDIRPLIESLARVKGGQSIDIVHLLPAFARARLFTYPPPPDSRPSFSRDCHWTAFNFFASEPDDRFCTDTEVVRALEDQYYRIFGNLQLGDVVMYLVGENAIHSCVYIADDFVFTKNGNTSARPWMLMKLDDMRSYYPTLKPLEVRYYRKKDI